MNTKERKIDEMAIVYRRLDTIKPLPGNAKLHDIQGIAGSISDSGFIDPIAVNIVTGHDIDGNGRLEALKMLYAEGKEPPPKIRLVTEKVDGKMATVWYAPTIDVHFDTETEPIVAMRLNRSHDKGGYDEKKVFAVLEQAAAYGRLEQTGYDQGIFEVLALKYAPAPEFEAPESQGGNGSSDYGSNGSGGNALPGVRPTMEPNTQQQPAQPLAPSKTTTVQIFLEAEAQQVFLESCRRLIQRGEIRRGDSMPVETLSELIFALVCDADLTQTQESDS